MITELLSGDVTYLEGKAATAIEALQARVTELEAACNKFSEAEILCRPVPARTLSESELEALANEHQPSMTHYTKFARAIETALKGGA